MSLSMMSSTLVLALVSGAFLFPANGFVSRAWLSSNSRSILHSTLIDEVIDVRTGKTTGTSFLPPETIERAKSGNPIEKAKLEKDGTSAFVDVYEYAKKIREGKMTWEEVEKADLDTVSRSGVDVAIPRHTV